MLLSIDRHSNRERPDGAVFRDNYHRHRRYSCWKKDRIVSFYSISFLNEIFSRENI